MPAVGDNIRIVASGSLPSGHPWECTWVWRITAINTGETLHEWLNNMRQPLSNLWVGNPNPTGRRFHHDFHWNDMQAVNLNRPTEETVQQVGLRGTRTIGYPAPPELTFVVALATGLRGRSYNGRIYWPCTDSRFVPNGNVDPNDRGVLQAFFNLLRFTGNQASNGVLCVWSRALSTDEIVFTTPVTSANLRGRVYWQRRRGVA